jgi:two-component system LytT family response regulator
VEASGSYSTLYLESGKRITVSKNLKRIAEMLQDPLFKRVHNSFLVRLASVQAFNHRKGVLQLPNGKEVPVAFRKREEVRRDLIQLMVNEVPVTETNLAAEDQGTFEKT